MRSIEVMHDWEDGDGRAAIDGLLDVYRRNSGGSADERTADSVRLSAKTGLLREDPPDVWFDWPGKNLEPYLEADVLADLTDVWQEHDLESRYISGARDVARDEDRYVALPMNIHRLNNLFYDVETVESAGVDPSDAGSPREFLEVLEQVVDATDAVGLIQPWKNPVPVLQLWETTLIGEFGADTYRSIVDGDVRANRGQIEEALELVRGIADFVPERSLFLDIAEAPVEFVSSNAAFYVQGDWSTSVFNAAEDFSFRADWGHAAFPGTEGLYQMNMDATLVPKMIGRTDAMDAFLATVGSVEGQVAFNAQKGSIPPRTDVPDDEFSPFQRMQMDAFEHSRSQPASVAHGLAVRPDRYIELLTTFVSFTETWDVDATTRAVVDVLGN
ncbi:ABC transporter substrate-binding protein [Halorhabdus amylolytica]|uniref:ABC transporter substrate-binding protein n=1 Tax=Halorhabdus amylolytica TaxID=2559573 RepID=UPI001B7D7800|nr:ABC transporter substrate-binding protein [Halorhabdus amylolytica]